MLMHHRQLFPCSVCNCYTSNEQRKVPMRALAGMVSAQLLHIADELEQAENNRVKGAQQADEAQLDRN